MAKTLHGVRLSTPARFCSERLRPQAASSFATVRDPKHPCESVSCPSCVAQPRLIETERSETREAAR